MNPKILLITDRPDLARAQAHALVCSGIEVSELHYEIVETKISAAELSGYDLLLLYMFDEESNSIELCRKLRADYHNPILLLLYARGERFLLRAYEAGADDCLVQPLSIQMLSVKVQAWLRRADLKATSTPLLEGYKFTFNPATSELVTPEDTMIRLSQLEARLLHLLIVNRGHIVTTDTILQRVWPHSHSVAGDRSLLKALVHRLRRKIERNPNVPQYIHTIPYEGYSFRLN
jgi:DNA-binding response OmpR family regulator